MVCDDSARKDAAAPAVFRRAGLWEWVKGEIWMKRWMLVLLALVLALALCACTTGEQENGGNAGDEQPETGDAANDPVEDGGADQDETDRPIYYFVEGQLVGSWEDGQWVSAVPLGNWDGDAGEWVSAGDGTDRTFTVAEILAMERCYVYDREMNPTVVLQCEFPTYSDGLGGFMDEYEREPSVSELLDSYAAYVPEESYPDRVFSLPTVLEGEAAELAVPNYSFYFSFGGQTWALAASQPVEWLNASRNVEEWGDDVVDLSAQRAAVESYLQERGLTAEGYDLEVVRDDLNSDRTDEYILLVNSPRDDALGFWSADGEDPYAFALVYYSDGTLETVYERTIPYTEDATELFSIHLVAAADLNGDGTAELCLRDGRWEWGFYYVMARQEDGSWQRVLQADNGM